jgi:hypothetical protein
MPFNIVCVRCNKLMATVEKAKVRDWVQTHDVEICDTCVAAESSLRKFYEKEKDKYVKQHKAVLDAAVESLDRKVRELAHGNHRSATKS